MPPLPGILFKMQGSQQAKVKVIKPLDGAMTAATNKRWGTIISNQMSIESGDAPVKNWHGSKLDFKKHSDNVNPNRILTMAPFCYAPRVLFQLRPPEHNILGK